jgi:hypothetical protein
VGTVLESSCTGVTYVHPLFDSATAITTLNAHSRALSTLIHAS